jgi:hypothetical protein
MFRFAVIVACGEAEIVNVVSRLVKIHTYFRERFSFAFAFRTPLTAARDIFNSTDWPADAASL